jgi:hypothetical protein
VKHLVAISIKTVGDDGLTYGEIAELVDFVLSNRDDPELFDWLEALKRGELVETGGGAAGLSKLEPISQNHLGEGLLSDLVGIASEAKGIMDTFAGDEGDEAADFARRIEAVLARVQA